MSVIIFSASPDLPFKKSTVRCTAARYVSSSVRPVHGARHSPMCQSRHSRVARMARGQVRSPYTAFITRSMDFAEMLPL